MNPLTVLLALPAAIYATAKSFFQPKKKGCTCFTVTPRVLHCRPQPSIEEQRIKFKNILTDISTDVDDATGFLIEMDFTTYNDIKETKYTITYSKPKQ